MSAASGRGRVALEVAVTSAAGARAARDGGADRVELCTALELGGLTPSPAALQECLELDGALDVHVLVRPRPGDFVHDADEVRTALRDVAAALRAGAAGVVVGALTAEGALDTAFLTAVAERARAVRSGAELTLHRAVDQLPRPSAAVPVLVRLGYDRVLTSGGAPTALRGAGELARAAALGGVQVVAGGGVGPASVAELVRAGVSGIHLSAKRAVGPRGPARVAVGERAGPGDGHWATDPAVVAEVRAALDAALAEEPVQERSTTWLGRAR